MNQTLFFNWLKRFDSYFGLREKREVLLFVDNCPAHGSVEVVPELNNIEKFSYYQTIPVEFNLWMLVLS